jgi:hypothetical protein
MKKVFTGDETKVVTTDLKHGKCGLLALNIKNNY